MNDGSSEKKAGEVVSEYLTFTLGKEEYGIDILTVQEIRGYDAVTRIPDSPEFVKGVINLRGTIVPVVDLRIKFKLGNIHYDAFTVMIILNVASRVVGVVVDSVSDVVGLTRKQIAPPPEFGMSFNTRYLTGIATIDERMLILVDIEKLLAGSEMDLFKTEQDAQAAEAA
jgi:purine-binding chemotaxis protein CheW